jgi:2-dehydro-3-deoxyphosphogluconate aldolase / (4S)-4-hydroxy-2-oxoglutarate aldolase
MSKTSMASILKSAPVIPIVTVTEVAQAVPLARALMRGGVRAVEITLRTAAAIDAIRAVASEVPEIMLGVGTVLNGRDLESAVRAGAKFALSPGITPALLAAAKDGPVPFLPGVATPSEVALALEYGFDCLKFFPAEAFGGVNALKAFAGPFPSARFCPTGGVSFENAPRYLALPNVVGIGGSWLTPPAAVAAGDWTAIEKLASAAANLRKAA